jgi:hypothetical protein
MIVFLDILTNKDVTSDSYPTKSDAKDGVMSMESIKITEGAVEVNIGGNNSAGGGEGGDDEPVETVDDTAETFLNVVRAHNLEKYPINDVKELKTLMKNMWAKGVKILKKRQYEAVGLDIKKAPKDSDAAKAALAEAADELADEADIKAYNEIKARLDTFEGRFKTVGTWVKKNIEDNFGECELYKIILLCFYLLLV